MVERQPIFVKEKLRKFVESDAGKRAVDNMLIYGTPIIAGLAVGKIKKDPLMAASAAVLQFGVIKGSIKIGKEAEKNKNVTPKI